MSTIQGAADRIAKQEIDLTRLEAQNYYRERQSLQNFTPYLGKAETRVETDGQKAEITYPGEAGACKVIIEQSYLWQGSPALRCPGGDWQAGVTLVLLVDLKNGETEEEVLEGNASSDRPWSQIDVPAQMTREAKKIEARAYIRFYNQLGNGSSALSDSVQIASSQTR